MGGAGDRTLIASRVAEDSTVRTGWDALPDDLLGRARQRLRRLLLVMIGLSAVALAVAAANLEIGFGTPRGARIGVVLHAALVALELAMLGVASRGSPRQAIAAALVWQVAACLVISIAGPWIVWEEQGVIPRVTWTSLLIAVVPLLLPAPPARIFAAALASAITVPAGLLGLELAGVIGLSTADLVGSAVSPALAVALAVVAGRITFGYGRDLARARELGAYRLLEAIGRGGMGEVWRAEHRLLARPAAIKLIRADLRSRPDASRRFEREARAIAALRSPHTVELYDFGVTEDGVAYYVMELLDGLDLQTLVTRFGPQPPGRVCRLLSQVCHSLAEAHEAGLIHRDIKPANIVVCRYGRDLDFVKVLDFGLVSLEREAAEIAGTPGYIAPEAALGESDARADLFGLGRVGLFLLTGDPLAPPEAVEDPALAALLEAAVATRPGDRPESAALLGQSLEALALWDAADAARWWSDNQPASIAAAHGSETRTM